LITFRPFTAYSRPIHGLFTAYSRPVHSLQFSIAEFIFTRPVLSYLAVATVT